MKLDPTRLEDWEIAQAAEQDMKSPAQLARDLGLQDDELIPMGRYLAKIDQALVMKRLEQAPTGHYIDVAGITPTPLGEGKTTTCMGLLQGLGYIGKRAAATIRQPSGGPTFNIKGSGAGGGLAQCIPLAPLSVRLTGDIDSITNAHNLALVALTARMQHERNYDDERLRQLQLKRLDIDPARVSMNWAIDYCAQALRHITIGKGSKTDGVEIESGFLITAASEVMAILSIATDLSDLRKRMAKIVVAYDSRGGEITTADLEVDGAMCAWMTEAINPNLLQTIEGQPVLVHAGPFANIALGQSSIIADRIGTRLVDYLVTESGFGADIGYEKFWNLKCRVSGLRPSAVVIVATMRALKTHGGGPAVRPGMPLDEVYSREHLGLLEKGCSNLIAHIEVVKRSGIRPVVCLNSFVTDTKDELSLVRRAAESAGAYFAVSDHWSKGGEGSVELAEVVVSACSQQSDFNFLYGLETSLTERVEMVAREVYGARGVSYSPKALEIMKRLESEPESRQLGTCIAKTHLSLSHDPNLKGRPTGWELPIEDVRIYKGAGLVVPVAGEIKLLPGTGSRPTFRRIDVDTKTGAITGLS